MNSLICLGVISYLFWKLHERFEFSVTTQVYYALFVSVCVIFVFLQTFFPELIYKVFKEIHDIQKKPLYDINAFNKYKEQNETNRYSQKQILHSKQGGRCSNCVNFIMAQEAESAYMNYKIPLENGGTNSLDNLKLICQGCHSRIF